METKYLIGIKARSLDMDFINLPLRYTVFIYNVY